MIPTASRRSQTTQNFLVYVAKSLVAEATHPKDTSNPRKDDPEIYTSEYIYIYIYIYYRINITEYILRTYIKGNIYIYIISQYIYIY